MPGSDTVDLVVGTRVAEVELNIMISAQNLSNTRRLIPRLDRSSQSYLSMNQTLSGGIKKKN